MTLATIGDCIRQLRGRSSRSEEQLAAELLGLAEALATVADYPVRMTLLCRSTAELLGCDRSSIFLRDDDHYRAAFNHGNPPDIAALFPDHRVSLRDPLISEAVRTGSFVIANDAMRHPLMDRETARRARIRAIVVAPLFRAPGDPLGFITAEYNQHRGRFSELDSTLVLGFAKLGELVQQAHEAAEQAATARERLRQAERLSTLGRLAGGIAHDFNNWLAVIGVRAELLGEEPEGPNRRQLIEEIQGATQSASALATQLLHFSRAAVGARRTANVSATLRALEGGLRSRVPAGMELRFQVGERDCIAACSEAEFEQLATNLVVNASEFSDPGAVISVALDRHELKQGDEDTARGLPPGTYASLSVRDTGRGIASEDIPRLFEPFYSTKPSEEGFGLGLSTVLGIAKKAGGEVLVDSAVGLGSEFRILLPIVASAPADETPPDAGGASAR